MKRKTKAQIAQEQAERERKRIEAALRLEAREAERARKLAKQKEEAKRRKWLRLQRSRPRLEVPSEYPGETLYVHKKIYEGFMKKRNITVTRCYAKGGSGGSLIMEYQTSEGGLGTLELLDLGPMPMG